MNTLKLTCLALLVFMSRLVFASWFLGVAFLNDLGLFGHHFDSTFTHKKAKEPLGFDPEGPFVGVQS